MEQRLIPEPHTPDRRIGAPDRRLLVNVPGWGDPKWNERRMSDEQLDAYLADDDIDPTFYRMLYAEKMRRW